MSDKFFAYGVILLWSLGLCIMAARGDDNTPLNNVSFKYGLGIIDSGVTTRVKAFGLRYEEVSGVLTPLSIAVEGGLWTDVGKAEHRSGSGYFATQVGVRPQSENTYFKAFVGPCAITHRDALLGGFFPQFRFDTGFGFQDKTSFIGINLSHISSAGIWSPNKGRDFLQMEAGIRF